jgi:hypothetical protein
LSHQKEYNIDTQSVSQEQIDRKIHQNFIQQTGSTTDIRARNAIDSDYKKYFYHFNAIQKKRG